MSIVFSNSVRAFSTPLSRLFDGLGRISSDEQTRRKSLLSRIRGYDFAPCSDEALSNELNSISIGQRGKLTDDDIAKTFAAVNEAIKRRLGLWRLFDAEFEKRGLKAYESCAKHVLDSAPYRDHLGYYTDPDFLDSKAFMDNIAPMLDQMGLDNDGRVIVKTIVCVAERGSVDYWSNILLPAGFYQALCAKDVESELQFHPTNEQILAGLALYEGNIVEMDAGEGKTIAAAFPAVAHALSGKSVHVITANDYLASRDAEWLAPVYESLGMSVGMVLGYMSDEERRHAYKKQIVYGTMRELGFDYLRDNLRLPPDEPVQSALDVVIVDEADHALIDQAHTPLIISGDPVGSRRGFSKTKHAVEEIVNLQARTIGELEARLAVSSAHPNENLCTAAALFLADPENESLRRRFSDNPKTYERIKAIINDDEEEDNRLSKDLYYVVDSNQSFVTLTEKGQGFLESRLGLPFDTTALENDLAAIEADLVLPLSKQRLIRERLIRRIERRHSQMNQAHQMLRAYVLLEKNIDYLVSDDEIVLIDKLTGRTLPDNVYQKGLHAAIQAKEGVDVQPELETLAQISVPGFIRQYSHASGMTGTAMGSADEFRQQYGLDVIRIEPSHRSKRKDFASKLCATYQGKLAAVIDEVTYWNRLGRPVLVGTLTVEQSDQISVLLYKHCVNHNLLNAVNSASEAQIIKNAGTFGAVTIATNMAGRGTDIILQPDLNERIIERFLNLANTIFHKDEANAVRIKCSTDEEAALLVYAFLSDARFNSASIRRELNRVLVAFQDSTPSSGTQIYLEFGLGLHVIGTEMNPSARVDRQLRGRSGRQGEFGSSRFILSLEDDALAFHAHKLATRKQGTDLRRRLSTVQHDLERDDSMIRDLARDYTNVIERQTLSFYESRREIMRSPSFQQSCIGWADGWASRFVERCFPNQTFVDYPRQFDRLVDALRLDLGIDACHLEGVGLYELVDEIATMIKQRLNELRALHNPARFTEIEKLLFLQTADQLWRSYLDKLQEDILNISLAGIGHKSAVAEYALKCFDAYEQFKCRAVDAFIPRLLMFPVEAVEAEQEDQLDLPLSHDIAEILV